MDALGLARFEGLQAPRAPGEGDSPARIREAAKAFEAVFVHQILKSMRATIQKSALTDGGYGEAIFTDMLDQEYAGIIAQRGLGLSALLASQLGAAEEAGASGELDELDEAAVQPPALQPAASQPAALQPAVITALSARPSMTEGAQAAASLRAPTRGRVTQTFGLNRHGARHEGLDIAAPEGQPIHAARAGVVRFAGARGAQGQAVIVDHGEGLTTLYAHASRLLVAPGARVAEGQAIARVGSTGQSTGAHLHFEARRDGQALDPAHLLGQPGLQVGELLKPAASTRALAAYGAAR